VVYIPLPDSIGETMSKFMPVFTGGTFGSNEIILPYINYMFESEEELKEANEKREFLEYFPFPVIFSRVLEVDGGIEGVDIKIAGTKVFCISGEWYDGVG